MGANVVETSVQVKDLDIYISFTLSWSFHVQKFLNLASSTLLRLKRNIPFTMPRDINLRLYNINIVSSMLYGSSVVASNLGDIERMERQQNRESTWIIGGELRHSATDRLRRLKLLPISLRLQLNNLNQFKKLVNGKYDVDISSYVQLKYSGSGLRRSNLPLFEIPRCRLKRTDSSFYHRVCYLANRLHIETRISVFDHPKAFKTDVSKLFITFLNDTYNRSKYFVIV